MVLFEGKNTYLEIHFKWKAWNGWYPDANKMYSILGFFKTKKFRFRNGTELKANVYVLALPCIAVRLIRMPKEQ